MTEIKITMVPRRKVEEMLSVAGPTRSIPEIIEDVAKIAVKRHKAVNLDDAQKLEELGIELIIFARYTHDCCFETKDRNFLANKELEKEACRVFVCPNLSLIDEACKKADISPEIIKTTKDLAIEYFKRTYHMPRYNGGVKPLLPAFLYIALNMQVTNGKRVLYVWGKKEYSQDVCCVIFGSTLTTTRKWIMDIIAELKIDYWGGPHM